MAIKDKLGRVASTSDDEKARMQSVAAKLGRGRSLRHKFTWPGGTAEIELQLLSINDVREAEAEALVSSQKIIGDNFIPRSEAAEVLESSKVKHLMARACMVPGTNDAFFSSAQELGDITTEDELWSVYKRYLEHKEECDPDPESFSAEQLSVVEDAIKKKASTTLKSIASGFPKSSLLILVNLLVTSLQDNSSST